MAYLFAPFDRRLYCCLLLSCLLLLPVLPASAEGPQARFEQALPGFKIVRVLWREGKLVLEQEGKLVVLRPGDSLPGQPLMKLVEVNERGAVLREAAASVSETEETAETAGTAVSASSVIMPNRLIKLERAAEGDGFSVVLLSAAETTAPAPEYEVPLAAQAITPGGGKPVNEKAHEAPLLPATQQSGGGGL